MNDKMGGLFRLVKKGTSDIYNNVDELAKDLETHAKWNKSVAHAHAHTVQFYVYEVHQVLKIIETQSTMDKRRKQ